MRALGIGKKKIKSSFIDQELYTKMKETNKKKRYQFPHISQE
jgi:hypothetical protein